MKEVKINEAKTYLSVLVDMLEKGEEESVLIYRGKKPVAKLIAYKERERSFGLFQGQFTYDTDAFESTIIEEEFKDYLTEKEK